MSELENITNESPEKGFFSKLASGDFGLAKTYWVYGVLVGFAVNILTIPFRSLGALFIILIVTLAYSVPWYMGIWRAANKYQGAKINAILAKIAVVLGVIVLAVGLFIGLLGQA